MKRADALLFVSDDFLFDVNMGREVHRRLAHAAASLILAIDRHPGDAVPRGVLAPLLADLRLLVCPKPDASSSASTP